MESRAVDMHAHVFVAGLPGAAHPRYLPDYAATPQSYLDLLDAHRIAGAVLVQPSFLGAHNGFLLDCVTRCPDRFRGVVVLDEQRLDDLAVLNAEAVVGVRLNLIDRRVPDLEAAQWRRLADTLAGRGQHLEVQARAEQWPALAQSLRRWRGTVVVDHLGLPGRSVDADRVVLDLASREHVWVKTSAPYRSPDGAAAEMLARVLDAAGPSRLLWGSDWPWTSHEDGRDFQHCLDWLSDLIDPHVAQSVITDNPARLLNWSPEPVPGRRAD